MSDLLGQMDKLRKDTSAMLIERNNAVDNVAGLKAENATLRARMSNAEAVCKALCGPTTFTRSAVLWLRGNGMPAAAAALDAWGKGEKAPAEPDALDAMIEAIHRATGCWPADDTAAVGLLDAARYLDEKGRSIYAAAVKAVSQFLSAHLAGKAKPAPERTCATCRHVNRPHIGDCALRQTNPSACGPDFHDWEPKPAPEPEAPKCADCGVPDGASNGDGAIRICEWSDLGGVHLCGPCSQKRREAARVAALRARLKQGVCVQHNEGTQAVVIYYGGTDRVTVNTGHPGDLPVLYWPLSDIACLLEAPPKGA